MTSVPTPLEQFMYWQCRLRQESVRKLDGRPSSGMQPTVSLSGTTAANADSAPRINVLVIKSEPESYTAHFRHIVRKTQDPSSRIKNGLQLLAEAYYQQSKGFSTELLALFAEDSELANSLLEHGRCVLDFAEGAQRYRAHCAVRSVPEDEEAHQAIYWHNHMFNSNMPGKVCVVGFTPQKVES